MYKVACTIKSNHEIAGVSPNLNTAAAPRKRYTRTNTAEHFIYTLLMMPERESPLLIPYTLVKSVLSLFPAAYLVFSTAY